MTDKKLRDLVADLIASQAKTDAQMAKTDDKLNRLSELYDRASNKTDDKLNRLSELYGGVSSNQGSAAEEFFFNSLSANPEVGGIKFDRVTPNVMPATKTKQGEFDIVMVNGNSVAVIEVKYKVHPAEH